MEGDRDAALFYEQLKSRRLRGWKRLMRSLPAEPRCAVCYAAYQGITLKGRAAPVEAVVITPAA